LFYNNQALGDGVTKGFGGVLYSASGSAYNGSGTPPTVTNYLTGCIFSNNKAVKGGAYFIGM